MHSIDFFQAVYFLREIMHDGCQNLQENEISPGAIVRTGRGKHAMGDVLNARTS
eukprot:m.105755 g.105755  ORF g.105755 m.105755 type:complete len:54 (+) comp13889_c0_seq2:224-385(+)